MRRTLIFPILLITKRCSFYQRAKQGTLGIPTCRCRGQISVDPLNPEVPVLPDNFWTGIR